jgi:nickel/cobalt transporter (NiCoT) family protein
MLADSLGSGVWAAVALAGLLGFRHGFDADHIAVVDGMTRARQLQRSDWGARWVGLQFAAGHSATILIAALLLFGQGAVLPAWLDGLGFVISTTLLLLIAASNAGHALKPSDGGLRPPGPVAALLFRFTGQSMHPALVGVAFALSLDSLAQAAFFAARGSDHSGMATVVWMALSFGAGMMLADAANGALLAWFASRSDRLARQASRFSSGFIALVALATATAAIVRESSSGMARAWDAAGVWVGVGLVVFTSLVYGLRIVLQRLRSTTTAH